MTIEVNGITFKAEELTTFSIEKLVVDSISHAHLFLSVNKRYFLVLRAGDFVDQEFLDKYTKRGVTSFYALEIANLECIDKYNNFWFSLSNTSFEHQRLTVKDQLFLSLYQDFWREDSKEAFLSFVISCNETFGNIESSVINTIQGTSLVLYSRSLLGGAHGIIAALANGYHDSFFLQDIYNLCFLLDYGLVTNNFNYPLLQACEYERKNPNADKKTLEAILISPEDRKFYFDHPNVSADLAAGLTDTFNYPEMVNAIRVHHEKINGSGFPNGLYYSCIASWESLLQYADYITPFEEMIFKYADGNDVFKTPVLSLMNDSKFQALPVNNIVQQLLNHFKWATTVPLEEVG